MPRLPNPKVYFAGPGIFRPNAAEIASELTDAARGKDLDAVWPYDGCLDDIAPAHRPYAIFTQTIGLMETCAAVVADISPFRGPHMDPGTAFVIGVAWKLNKPVFAYTDALVRHAPTEKYLRATTLGDRIWCDPAPDGAWRDANGIQVEDFDLTETLMIACAVHSVAVNAGQAIIRCRSHLTPDRMGMAS